LTAEKQKQYFQEKNLNYDWAMLVML
jgi:hypothetical protein